MEKSKILCYNVDESTVALLKALASRLKISVVSVPFEDFSKPVAVVASGISTKNNPLTVPSFTEGMAVFVSVPDTMLDVLLSAMKERGIKIPLKAVLTPYNAVWDANTLYNELCAERREMSGK
jgi:hypothetical protein